MTGTKRIIAVDIRQVRQLAGKLSIPSFFTRVETQILQDQALTRLQSSPFFEGIRTHRIGREENFRSEQGREPLVTVPAPDDDDAYERWHEASSYSTALAIAPGGDGGR